MYKPKKIEQPLKHDHDQRCSFFKEKYMHLSIDLFIFTYSYLIFNLDGRYVLFNEIFVHLSYHHHR